MKKIGYILSVAGLGCFPPHYTDRRMIQGLSAKSRNLRQVSKQDGSWLLVGVLTEQQDAAPRIEVSELPARVGQGQDPFYIFSLLEIFLMHLGG